MAGIIERLRNGDLPTDFNWNRENCGINFQETSFPQEPTPEQIGQLEIVSEDLRDGLHGVYEYPSVEKMLEYVGALHGLGIDRVTVGIYTENESKIDRSIKKLLGGMAQDYPQVTPIVLSLSTEKSLQWLGQCKQMNPRLQAIVFMGTAPSRLLVEGWNRDFILKNLGWAIKEATERYGVEVIGATEHTTQTPPDFLEEIIRTAVQNGAHSFCIADTIGTARPVGANKIVRFTRGVLAEIGAENVSVEWHGHEDTGNAWANALQSITAGANRVHTVARGVGERAGNTRMETLLVNLNIILEEANLPSPWKMNNLMHVLSLYDKLIKSPPPSYGPLGSRSHTTSLGIHTAAILKAESLAKEAQAEGEEDLSARLSQMARQIYTAVDPALIGKKHEFRVSHWSGVSSVELAYLSMGGDPDTLSSEQIQKVLKTAKNLKKELSPEELLALLNSSD